LHEAKPYCTLNVMGVAGLVYDPDVPLTLMVYVPFGVPGLPVEPLEFPPHDAIQSVDTPSIAINASNFAARSERFREPATNMTPKNPGSIAA